MRKLSEVIGSAKKYTTKNKVKYTSYFFRAARVVSMEVVEDFLSDENQVVIKLHGFKGDILVDNDYISSELSKYNDLYILNFQGNSSLFLCPVCVFEREYISFYGDSTNIDNRDSVNKILSEFTPERIKHINEAFGSGDEPEMVSMNFGGEYEFDQNRKQVCLDGDFSKKDLLRIALVLID